MIVHECTDQKVAREKTFRSSYEVVAINKICCVRRDVLTKEIRQTGDNRTSCFELDIWSRTRFIKRKMSQNPKVDRVTTDWDSRWPYFLELIASIAEVADDRSDQIAKKASDNFAQFLMKLWKLKRGNYPLKDLDRRSQSDLMTDFWEYCVRQNFKNLRTYSEYFQTDKDSVRPFRRWLERKANWFVLTKLRRHGEAEVFNDPFIDDLPSDAPSALEELIRSEDVPRTRKLVLRTLEELPLLCQIIILARVIDGHSSEDILMYLPELKSKSNVDTRFHRCKMEFRTVYDRLQSREVS